MNKANVIIILSLLFVCIVTIPAKTITVSYTDEVELTTQHNTGVYWRDNCGVASLYTVLEYMGYDLGNVEKIRRDIKNQSGWLYTDEIEDYLCYNEINYDILELESEDDIINAIDKGVLIMCLDMSKISNRGYDGNITGHFVTIVGYVYKNGEYLLEVYDPMSYKVCYYKLNEVFLSASEWWEYLFLFEKNEEILE